MLTGYFIPFFFTLFVVGGITTDGDEQLHLMAGAFLIGSHLCLASALLALVTIIRKREWLGWDTTALLFAAYPAGLLLYNGISDWLR